MMLPPHGLKVVLVEPEIPQNAGNIGRLCAAVGAQLHLVRPLGFILTDRNFRRAGMDYLRDIQIHVHNDLDALLHTIGTEPIRLTSGLAGKSMWESHIPPNAWIFFGKESAGLPTPLLEKHTDHVLRIPMVDDTRGLNISTAAGIIIYEVLRQIAGMTPGTR